MPKAKVQAQSKAISQSSKKPTKAAAPTKKAPAKVVPQVKAASKPIKKDTKKVPTPPSSLAKGSRPSAQPKKPSSAYVFFNNEMQTQMKSMKKFQTLDFSQRSKVVSESWSKLKQEQKTEYMNSAAEDKKRYDRELKQLEKKGFFKNKDGKDSRDLLKSSDKKEKAVSVKSKKPAVAPKKAPKTKKALKQEAREAKEAEKKKDGNICVPKRPCTGYVFFMTENGKKIRKTNPELKVTEVMKRCAEDWKKVSDASKKKYEKMNEKDKERYQKENKEFETKGFFINSDGVKSTLLNKNHQKLDFEYGTVLPKRVKHAYFIFLIEQQKLMIEQVKEGEKFSVGPASKAIAEKWNKMTDQQKKKYEKMQADDVKRLNDQLDQLKKKGFFMTTDGKKSTDLTFKPPKIPKRKEKKEIQAAE